MQSTTSLYVLLEQPQTALLGVVQHRQRSQTLQKNALYSRRKLGPDPEKRHTDVIVANISQGTFNGFAFSSRRQCSADMDMRYTPMA